MRLSFKVLLIILITWSLMLSATYLASQKILLEDFISLGQEQAKEDVVRATEAIDQMVTSLSELLLSYAVWDDSYQFILDKNQAYVDGNLSVSVLSSSDLDMVLYFDAVGNLFFSVALDKERTKSIPIPPDLSIAFKQGNLKKFVNPVQTTSAKGLVSISEGILLLAISPIVKSDQTGPPRGSIIMAKYFNKDKLLKIMDVTKLDLQLYPKSEVTKNPNLSRIDKDLTELSNPLIKTYDEKTLLAYTFLKDINDTPIAIIEAKIPRTFYLLGKKTISYFYNFFIFVCILSTLILFFLLRFSVIKRLQKMSETIIKINESRNILLKLPEGGNDEIHNVSSEINKMLSIIKIYNDEKQELLDNLTHQCDEENKFAKKLIEAEEFLTDIIGFMPSWVVILDHNFKILNLNFHALKNIQYSFAEAKGKNLFVVFPYLKNFQNKFTLALTEKKAQVINKISYHKEEKTNYLNAILYPLIHNEAQYLVLRIDDVTEQVKLKEKLVYNEKLVSIGLLTSGVAHEINGPIHSLTTSVNPLESKVDIILNLLQWCLHLRTSDEFSKKIGELKKIKEELHIDVIKNEINKLLEVIHVNADRTAKIVNNLRIFTRFDESMMKPADVHEGIESTLHLLEHKYKNKIKIIKEYGEIPLIFCFPGKLNQVYFNVLNNAIESIENEGQIVIRTLKSDKDHVQIIIIDNGKGIKKEDLSKIFDPFYTTKSGKEDMGLGLSISMTIVQAHRGSIVVNSELGKSSTFIITLPIKLEEKKINHS